ncbi:MAG: FdrA family protein [Actinomycetota bacterium]
MIERIAVESGSYHDSVTLMAVGGEIGRREGVDAALVAMATELNVGLLGDLGFAVPDGATPNDLVIAVRAVDDDTADHALAAATARLAERSSSSGSTAEEAPPPTTAAATRRATAQVALVSTPGASAFVEAVDALRSGLHVVVFSDNVPIDQEQQLKAEAAERDLLLMGPDCGTVVLGGLGLGFANVVRPGPVSLVAASGTGAQQACALLAHADVGVNHVLGVGGRDLSDEIGGASTIRALRMLDDDPATELIGLVVKSATDAVNARIADAVDRLDTPVLHIAADRPGDDLTAGTDRLLERLGVTVPRWPSWVSHQHTSGPGPLRGLFAGGTLCREALTIAEPDIGTLSTNLRSPDLDPATPGHVLLDLGADEMTQGRPHPMIDQLLRLRRLEADAVASDGSVILLDVVLGHGAHPDPASELVPAIAEARQRDAAPAVVVSIIGTPDDPQGLVGQAEALAGAGADVFVSNAEAARHATSLALGVSS